MSAPATHADITAAVHIGRFRRQVEEVRVCCSLPYAPNVFEAETGVSQEEKRPLYQPVVRVSIRLSNHS